MKNGCFKTINRVNNEAVKEVVFDKKDAKKPLTLFKKKMSNYFSIGIDARIGLGYFWWFRENVMEEGIRVREE